MDSSQVAQASPHATRVVVIGAGISGLSTAWFARRRFGDRVALTVLDGADRVGGKLLVSPVAGLPVDAGAEAMLNRRPEAVDLAREIGLGEDVRYPATASAGVWSYGAVRPLPRGTVMGVPADVDELRGSGVVSPAGVDRVAREPELADLDLTEDVAIGGLVAARMGHEVVDRLVEPLLGGVYAGHADQLSLEATVPALAAKVREHGSLIAAARALQPPPAASSPDASQAEPVFAGLDGGVGRLVERLVDVLSADGVRIRTGTMVRELARTTTGWRLTVGPTRDPELVEADAVIIACPATPAARLLTEAIPAAAVELAQIEYASMAVITAAFRTADVPDTTGSGFLVPPVEGRFVKAVTFASRKWGWLAERDPELTVLRCSVGRHGEVEQLQTDDAELTRRALTDVRALTGISGEPVATRVTRWGGALPQYTVGHLDRVRRIQAAVADAPGLAVCGAAYEGLGVAACIGTARQAAEQVGVAIAPGISASEPSA